MAGRLGEMRRDPGFRDLAAGWLIAAAAFAAGRIGTLAVWIGLSMLVVVLLLPPLLAARRDDRRRRLMLLILGLVTAVLISAMANSALILGILGLLFFFVTFLLGWELSRGNRVESNLEQGPGPAATS